MKTIGSALLALALHYAAADEQAQTWGQASGLSDAKFLQDATAFLDLDDADTLSLSMKADTHGTKVHDGTKEFHKHGVTSVTALRAGSKLTHKIANAAAGETVKSTMAVKATRGRLKIGKVAAVAASSAKATSVQTQLAQAVRVQFGLRKRLRAVGTLARNNLAMLLKQLKVAKTGSQKTETKLRNQIKKETSKLEKEEASERHLRSQLAVAQASAVSARQAAAAATSQDKADRDSADKLRKELIAERTQATKETSRLQEQLHQLQQAEAKTQRQSIGPQLGLAQLPKPIEVASPTLESLTTSDAKSPPKRSTLQMMAAFFATPLHR